MKRRTPSPGSTHGRTRLLMIVLILGLVIWVAVTALGGEPSEEEARFGPALERSQLVGTSTDQGSTPPAVADPLQRLDLVVNELARRLAKHAGDDATLSQPARDLMTVCTHDPMAGLHGFTPGNDAYAPTRTRLVAAYRAIGRADLAAILELGATASAAECTQLRNRWGKAWSMQTTRTSLADYATANLDAILAETHP
jgi:hypothetical protein